jgi:CRP/FNR family transcriptional regulator, dissimilatory nitrate respiration regulator
MHTLAQHPDRNVIRLLLKQNELLKEFTESDLAELEQHLSIFDGNKGDWLLYQGTREMEQYFIVEGILKRVVANAEGKEMILRFAEEREAETCYAAWRLGTPAPYGVVSVTKVRVARMPLLEWANFLESRPRAKAAFEFFVMRVMSEIMAHTITLHLLDAPGRMHRFVRKHPSLVERIPQKQLASFLNLSPETLSRLRSKGKI